jgi:hypothetical protein
MSIKKPFVLGVHALVGWVLCGVLIGIGRNIWSMDTTLIVHAIGVPLIFAIISYIYFKKFAYTTPLQTALFFLCFAVVMDFLIVSLLIEKSFAMFGSPLGTWIPFLFIFLSTFVIGSSIQRHKT